MLDGELIGSNRFENLFGFTDGILSFLLDIVTFLCNLLSVQKRYLNGPQQEMRRFTSSDGSK